MVLKALLFNCSLPRAVAFYTGSIVKIVSFCSAFFSFFRWEAMKLSGSEEDRFSCRRDSWIYILFEMQRAAAKFIVRPDFDGCATTKPPSALCGFQRKQRTKKRKKKKSSSFYLDEQLLTVCVIQSLVSADVAWNTNFCVVGTVRIPQHAHPT